MYGVIAIPYSKNVNNIQQMYDDIKKQLDVTYIGDIIAEQIEGNSKIKEDFIMSYLKSALSLNKRFIFCNFKNNTVKERRELITLAKQSKYTVICLVIDKPSKTRIIDRDPDYDEGFDHIFYTERE